MKPAQHRHHSLGTKLIIAFGILGLGPLIVTSIVSLQLIGAVHRQNISAVETQLLRQKIEEIDKFFKATLNPLEIRVGYEQVATIKEQDQKFLLESILRENKFLLELSFVDLAGQETSKLFQSQEGRLAELLNIQSTPEFQKANSGQQYISQVQYTKDGPVVTLGSPVFNRNSQLIMVVRGELSLAPIQEMMVLARLGQSGYVFAVDAQGTILASTDKDFVSHNIGSSTWIQKLLAGASHTGLEREDIHPGLLGIEVVAAGIPFKERGWGIVAEWPKQDAFSVIAAIQRQAVGFSFATILFVAFFGWLVGRKILRPLAILGQGAKQIGGGNFEYKISISTGDELEELGEIVNRMGEDLKRLEELKAAEIRAEALAESLRKEQELSRAKDELIRNVSHQLRTPLSIVNWNLELFTPEATKKEQAELLANAQKGAEQLSMIVQDVILLAEFGPAFQNTVSQETDMGALIEKVIADRQAAISKKHITLNTELVSLREMSRRDKKEGLKIFANSVALQAVFENLIDNALTYTPDNGKVTITLTKQGEGIACQIADSGIGIPKKDQSLIFSQFFRAENAIAMKNVGTGLGLYIAKNIIAGHKGKIWFESTEGKGTVFFFTIPSQSVKH